MKKWLKIINLFTKLCLSYVSEVFEHKQWYRRLVGGRWFLVCEFDTGDEYWTSTKPDSWIAVIVEEENYEIQ